jgi:miniconductance mechanosensitive channel
MEALLTELQALLLPRLHELLNRLGLDPERGSLLDRFLLLLLGKAVAVWLVVWGQRLLLGLIRRAFEYYHRRQADEATAPYGSALQMATIFVRSLTVLAIAGILLDLTVNRLVTLISASAALVVLLFRDTVLGFVSGTLLLRNRMIRTGDYLSVTNPTVQGQIEEITIMTVRLRAHDNTFYFVPTYSLLTRTFQNWSGMKERGARMMSHTLLFDVDSLRLLTAAEWAALQSSDALFSGIPQAERLRFCQLSEAPDALLNMTLFRQWVSLHLRYRPEVQPQPFLLVRHPLASEGLGFPLELLFFVRSTVWLDSEQMRTRIVDGVVAMLPAFGLRMYQSAYTASGAGVNANN